MKPGETPEIVAVLDSEAECRILEEYFDSREFMQRNMAGKEDSTETPTGSIVVRFIDASQMSDSSGFLIYKENPEFEVRLEDETLVRAAAKKVLRERNPIDKLLTPWNKRLRATKTIKQFLDSKPSHSLSQL